MKTEKIPLKTNFVTDIFYDEKGSVEISWGNMYIRLKNKIHNAEFTMQNGQLKM